MFLLALLHSAIAVIVYHTGTDANPIVSIFVTDAGPRLTAFPFQAFGFAALMILFVMAATSHDFWLANLTAPIWKTLHLSVYVAYALLVIHVAFGFLQSEFHLVPAALLAIGATVVCGAHLLAGWKQAHLDQPPRISPAIDGFLPVCAVDELVEDQPFGALVGGERIAILRYEGNKVSVVSGVCQHQNGPLAEGRFVYGCLTCPWHGYQYLPANGCSPAPFTEKIPTFQARIENGTVWVHPQANPAGTAVAPALIDSTPQ
jgi:nitrite reductase/ring-hydroxylating ferredoxin subunit